MSQSCIITIANQKGGVGKTTVTALIAKKFSEEGKKVAVIDTDPQSSLHNHLLSISNEIDQNLGFHFYKTDINNVEKFIQSLKNENFSFILIDTLPATCAATVRLILLSNLVLIPVGSTSLDISATLQTISLLDSLKKSHKVIFNNIKSLNDKDKLLPILCNIDYKIDIAKNFLSNRLSFARYLSNNLVLNDKKAQQEVNDLYKEIVSNI